MENKNLTATIEVAQSPLHVFNCITNVPKWWSEDFEGSCCQLNDEFTIHHPKQHYSKQKLVEVIPGKKMGWLVTDSTLHWLHKHKHEWTNTKMIFELSTSGDKTILHFTHEGLIPGMECYAMCQKGWSMIITDWFYYYIIHGTPSPEMSKAAEIRDRMLNGEIN